ncbi:MAG: SGNH/GDSL hydrolase family protein [Planctomycetota bacterium]
MDPTKPPTIILVCALAATGLSCAQPAKNPTAAREEDETMTIPETYHDPARFADQIAQFEAADAEAKPAAGAIVCVGSSSMRRWHEWLDEDLAPLTVIGRGFGGSNMADVLHYVDRVVLTYRPRAVLLYEGDNDVALGATPEAILALFRALTARIHGALPDCRVYVMSVKPSPSRWAMWPRMVETNHLLKAACDGDGRLTFIDVATPMLGGDGKPAAHLYKDDDLHMVRAGYDVWRDAVRPVLMAGEARYE